jgi:hypothetical protein
MKILYSFAFTFLLSTNGSAQENFEKPADTVQYLINGNWDNYLAWNLSQQPGSAASKQNYNGINNDGIIVINSFSPTGGWFDMNISLSDTLSRKYPFVFYIRSSSTANDKLEIKFTDNDGSVFRRMVPLDSYSNRWSHIVVYLGDTDYAWGGDSKFGTFARFSIAASGTGSDTIWLDEIGIGKPGLRSAFPSLYDPDSTLAGIGFAQRRDSVMLPEDPLVLKYLKVIQDISSQAADLLPSQEDDQAQTFNNSMVAIAYITKDEKERAERILDYYADATVKNNPDISLQNFYFNGEARGFYQWVSLKNRHAPSGTVDRWVGDMAWLLIACKNYEQKYDLHRYDELIKIIRDLMIAYYKESDYGGYIQSGWRSGDKYLHEPSGHHEGNIDCYVALKLCGENYYAQKIKIWLEHQLKNQKNLPLDLYTWRVLAFGSDYSDLLDIPDFNYSYRKILDVNGVKTMGFYNTPDFAANNFWNDGTGHIACAYQAFGEKERGYFYANQLDPLIIDRISGADTCHTIPYTLNKTGGYSWVDTTKGFVSCAAWYILAKNGINPYMSENFEDTVLSASGMVVQFPSIPPYPNPFGESLTIDFYMPYLEEVNIEVCDILGVKIQTLFQKNLTQGNHSFTWNGNNYKGQRVSRGTYLLNVTVDKHLTGTYKIIKTGQ